MKIYSLHNPMYQIRFSCKK